MRPAFRLYLLILLLVFTCGQGASAKNVFKHPSRDHRVVELPLGIPYVERNIFPVRDTGLQAAGSASRIFVVNVRPGDYVIAVSSPYADRRVDVSVFDRWPHDSRARRVALRNGPLSRSGGKETISRWQVGVSPASTSSQLYIRVDDGGAFGYGKQAPVTISVFAASSYSKSPFARGGTLFEGPSNLVLRYEQSPASYVIENPPDLIAAAQSLPALPIYGDIVKNSRFKEGLNSWTLHRNYAPADSLSSISITDQGLRISGSGIEREGLMQRMNVSVSDAKSLILRADVMVTEQSLGGTGANGRDAPIAIAVGYEKPGGSGLVKETVFWKGFYALPPDKPDRVANGQKVPDGLWYRYIFDLMQLKTRPGIIKFISLEGSGQPGREGWVRDVHLIKVVGK